MRLSTTFTRPRPTFITSGISHAMTTVIAFALVGLATGGCTNILKEFATTNTNDAYLAEARTAMNERDYDRALGKLLALTPEYQNKREVTATIAGAYAGRCGLEFLDVVQSVIDNPTTRLFNLLVGLFRRATTGRITDCATAETYLRKLAPGDVFTQMSQSESLFLAVVSVAKIGAVLGTYADLNHDGVADPSFDACNTTKFPDAQARALGVSLNLVLAAVAASGNTTLTGSVSGVGSVCSGLPPGQNFCGIFDPAGFTPQMIQVLGGLVQSQDAVGLGTCANTLQNCVCP